MALKEGLTAIRAEWLWVWKKSGSLKVNLLVDPKTRVFIVKENSRPSITFHEKDGAKRTIRYWLAQGTILNPRWDLLSHYFDPVADQGIEKLEPEKLVERFMFRLKDGQIVVLIYQHVEDLSHFLRQQEHVQDDYTIQAGIISSKGMLDKIEDDFGRWLLQDRKQQIDRILDRITSKEKAAKDLRNELAINLKSAEKSIRSILSSEPMKELAKNKTVSAIGMIAHIVSIYTDLNKMKVLPLVPFINLTQFHIRGAIGALNVRELERACSHIESAIDHLQEAQDSIKQSSALKKSASL